MVRRLILAILLVGISSAARSFDGTPQGFMLGGGVGVAGSFISQDLDGSKFDDFFEPGASFDLRAGWGIGGSIFLYASARGSFIQYDTVNLLGSDTMHGVFGLGVMQVFDQGRSNWYSTAHLGMAWFDLLEEPRADALTGFGFGGGFGYRWHPHLGVEFVAGWEQTTIELTDGEFGNSILTFRFQIVGMAY